MYRAPEQRKYDYHEVERRFTEAELRDQTSRCLNCGIPFCHGFGCPLGNVIPEFNRAAHEGRYEDAFRILSMTSYFPEFTSRVCPALCEGSCTQGIDTEAVMIRQVEKFIIETAFERGWVRPVMPTLRTGKKAAVIGGGPSGLSAAETLNRLGFSVTLYERCRRPGGLMRYGIPDFKLEKQVIDRRLAVMEEEGIHFVTGANVGTDLSAEYLRRTNDLTVAAIGTDSARDLKIPGRDLPGIHFALEFLRGQNRVNSGELAELPVSAKGKRVLVIGGGDTGSDCVGTATRQGAVSVEQIEIMPRPPERRSHSTPWPLWPYLLRTSSSHLEGCGRRWNLSSLRFLGEKKLEGVEVQTVEWSFTPEGKPLKFVPVPNTVETIPADLVLLAMGFTGVNAEAPAQFGMEAVKGRFVSVPEKNLIAAGDCKNGATLVVRSIADAKDTLRKLFAK